MDANSADIRLQVLLPIDGPNVEREVVAIGGRLRVREMAPLLDPKAPLIARKVFQSADAFVHFLVHFSESVGRGGVRGVGGRGGGVAAHMGWSPQARNRRSTNAAGIRCSANRWQ
jgi:hypothetical protein